ncbi:MAG TPA: O-antigen ligase family protein, partial [Rhodocyclaceae bacterium]|nr:O-antigen ligase family protein [Rhodocyclaceae bacterium]
TVIGLIHGYWFKITYHRDWLQLNSVGQVNHSALYGAGIAMVAIVLTAVFWRSATPVLRTLSSLLSLALLGVMFTWGSRGALLTYLLGVVIFGLHFVRVAKVRVWPIVLLSVVVASTSLALNPLIIKKTQDNFSSGDGAGRLMAARTASEIWRHFPITGVGAANFSQISPEQIDKWLAQRNEQFVYGDYLFSSHAHNVYFNTLAERGIVGLVALLALMALWTIELVRRRPNETSGTTHWLCWGAALSGWVVVFAGGVFNTTLHHEHGMLAMCFLGLLLGSVPGPSPTPPVT